MKGYIRYFNNNDVFSNIGNRSPELGDGVTTRIANPRFRPSPWLGFDTELRTGVVATRVTHLCLTLNTHGGAEVLCHTGA